MLLDRVSHAVLSMHTVPIPRVAVRREGGGGGGGEQSKGGGKYHLVRESTCTCTCIYKTKQSKQRNLDLNG